MAIKSLNSVGGFSVKDGSGNIVVIIDENGNVSAPTLTVSGTSNLGPVGNVTITGGSNGQVLTTNGAGGLSWADSGGGGGNTWLAAPMPYYIAPGETYYVTANHQGLFSQPLEIDGAFEVDGVLEDVGGPPSALSASVNNVIITGGTNGYVLQTDGTGNLTWTAQTGGGGSANPSGANTQVQFNDAGVFGANAGFTFNNVTGLLTSPYFSGDGSGLSSVAGANVSGQVNYAATANSVAGANVSGQVNYAATANSVAGANVSGQVSNALVAGTIYTNAQPNITSTGTLTTLSVSGNANIGNIGTAGLITATGNVTAGNLVTSGVVSATGNANVGNIGTALITATGNITGGNLVTSGVISVTGNANIGNIGTGGLITATGNIRGANLVTSGVLSVTGNANIGNIGTAGLITATGNITGGNLVTGGALSVTGNATAGQYQVSGKQAVNGPAFSAYANATLQTITSGSQQKVLFQTEEFDTNNNYASSRFTPTVEGYYQLNAEVRLDGASGTGEMMIVIWKNGSEYKRGTNQSGTQIATNFWAMTVNSLVYANGSTDYFEIYIQQGSGGSLTVTAVNNPAITWFNGCMVRGA